MTLSEKLEQTLLTGRPDSYIPAKTLTALLGLPPRPETDPSMWTLNLAMHYGQGILAGGIRGIMAWNGMRGPFADFMFMGIRLCIDQGLENVAGVGCPPWTWPVQEQVIDLCHKAVYAFSTGYFADMWVR